MWKVNKGYYGEIIFWECSKCGFALELYGDNPKEEEFYYCPRCGYKHIRMRKKDNDKK